MEERETALDRPDIVAILFKSKKQQRIQDIEKEMKVAADLLEFEVAARLRDELKEIKKEIMELPS